MAAPPTPPTPPSPDVIAAQLRKPSGPLASVTAQNMDKSNAPLFDLTLQSMDLQGDERVLEIGFGSGSFMQKLFSHRDHLQVTGVDYSPEMVQMAESNNDDLIRAGRLRLEEASSERLPFEDESFDVVFCNMVIYFWDPPEEHLREVWRVLRPEGEFYSGFRTEQSMRGFPFAQYGFTFYEPEEWKAVLERNGFQALRTDRKMDPQMEVNGRQIQLESVCVVAQKRLAQPPS